VAKVRALVLEGGVEVEFEGPIGHGMPGHLDRGLFYIRAMERPWDRVRYWLLFATTPYYDDWEGLRLPDFLFPVYYVLRPLRMSKFFARWLWRQASGASGRARRRTAGAESSGG
jgi:hypothetical protein